MLILRRIHVTYHLSAPAALHKIIGQIHDFHARFCPVYRSLTPTIEITTELELTEDEG